MSSMAPIAFLLLAAAPCCIAISVFDYGAIANDTSFEAAVANGKAWYDVFDVALPLQPPFPSLNNGYRHSPR